MRQKKRVKRVEFRLTEPEYNHLIKDYEVSGLPTLTHYARAMLFKDMKKRPFKERKTTDEKLINQVKRVGNNINQIARKLNSGEYGQESEELVYRLQLALKKLEKSVFDVQAHQQKEEQE
jgi:hypothetical protein